MKILVSGQQPIVGAVIAEWALTHRHECLCSGNMETIWQHLASGRFDVVLVDISGTDPAALGFIGRIRQTHPKMPMILMVGPSDLEVCADGWSGLTTVLEKPIALSELSQVLDRMVPPGTGGVAG